MPPFPKPKFEYDYDLGAEREALEEHRGERAIPEKRDDRLLLATWNIANLGVQKRRPKDYELLAHIVGWFDLVAVQEANDDLSGLRALHEQLPDDYRVLFSDVGGNRERQAFLYDATKVTLLEKVGRLSIPPADLPKIKLAGIDAEFEGFDRGPYLAAFRAGSFTPLLVNVHLYFGSDSPEGMARRTLETFAVARWADLRRKSDKAFTRDIVPLGDFNLPSREPDDQIYRELTRRGLTLPDYSSSAVGGSSLGGRNHYDQIAFFPGETSEFSDRVGIFDFDNALFRDLWESRTPAQFLTYARYYVSDHRPYWAEFRI